MAFQVNWTERALADLAEIASYIAADRPNAAEREGGEIIRRADFLVQFPQLGPIYRVTENAEYRSVVSGNYRIIYYIKPDAPIVDITAIWHCARDIPDLP
jgi:plasmid stabilization system protein ParE